MKQQMNRTEIDHRISVFPKKQELSFIDNRRDFVSQTKMLAEIRSLHISQNQIPSFQATAIQRWNFKEPNTDRDMEIQLKHLEKNIEAKLGAYPYPNKADVTKFLWMEVQPVEDEDYSFLFKWLTIFSKKINLYMQLSWFYSVRKDSLQPSIIDDVYAILDEKVRLDQEIEIDRAIGQLNDLFIKKEHEDSIPLVGIDFQNVDSTSFLCSLRLDGICQDTFQALPKVMQNESNRKMIRSLIDIKRRGDKVQIIKYGMKMKQILVDDARRVEQRILNDKDVICKKFSIENDVLSDIYLTDSDPHNGGQRVYIVEFQGNKKVVYKPKDLSAEYSIFGNAPYNTIVSLLNTRTGIVRLPSLGYLLCDDYGYMEYVDKVVKISEEQARFVYYEFGQMVIFGKMLGMTDLHQDNMLVGKKGDVFSIDAEMCFIEHVVKSSWMDATYLKISALTIAKGEDGRLANSMFYVEGEFDESKDMSDLLSLLPAIRQKSFSPGGKYYSSFYAGIQYALEALSSSKDIIMSFVKDIISSKINKVRIPLRSTADLRGDFLSYYLTMDITKKNEVVVQEVDFLKSKIQKLYEGYSFINIHAIRENIILDFENLDIPYFFYSPMKGEIYMHDDLIAKVSDEGYLIRCIEDEIDRLSMKSVKDVLLALGIQ